MSTTQVTHTWRDIAGRTIGTEEQARADEVAKGSALWTSAGWCPVLAVHVMPKTVRLDLLTDQGERTITPRRGDMLTVLR